MLPNLFTAGNLACGFFALIWIFKYQPGQDFEPIRVAIRFILAAFAFDFFDGRMARLARKESPFGREFDSLADIVSFGVAPAFLLHRIVLYEFANTGFLIAVMYLVCGGIRLARFNVLSQMGHPKGRGEFVGFPIPSGAALVVSMTMFVMWVEGHERQVGEWKWLLLGLMILVSVLMVSNVRYPTFKNVEWTLQRGVAALAAAVTVVLLLATHFEATMAALFVAYMLYGLVRPWVSRRWRQEIESEGDEDENDAL